MSAVEVETVLVPVDGSDEAVRAAEYAVAVAARYDAGVHALYVLEDDLARGVESGAFEEGTVAARHDRFVEAVREFGADVPVRYSTAYGYSSSRLARHPGSVVLDVAADVGADFLVVPREPVTGDPDVVLGKAAEYVLSYASQPVLSV